MSRLARGAGRRRRPRGNGRYAPNASPKRSNGISGCRVGLLRHRDRRRDALCAVRASNPGHLLYMRIARAPRAPAPVATQLMYARFFSGWGIRTLAVGEARYNPMSYHNGSVWPHDSALCAAGIWRATASARHRCGCCAAHSRPRCLRHAPAGTVLRLPARARRRAGRLSRRVPAAGVGGGLGLHVCCRPAWASTSTDRRRKSCSTTRACRPAWRRLSIRNLALGERRAHLVLKRLGDRVAVFVEGPDAAGVVARVRG